MVVWKWSLFLVIGKREIGYIISSSIPGQSTLLLKPFEPVIQRKGQRKRSVPLDKCMIGFSLFISFGIASNGCYHVS